MNHRSLSSFTTLRALVIAGAAAGSFACTASGDVLGDADGAIAHPESDAGVDRALSSDVNTADQGGSHMTDAEGGARDGSSRDSESHEATSVDASGRDAGQGDASFGDAVDGSSVDASAEDRAADPTGPRFPRTGRYGTTIAPIGDAGAADPADVYYPDPPDLQTGRYAFPVVLLLQGAKVGRSFYSGVSAGVAAYGFIVVVPDHVSNNVGGPGLYAELGEIAAVAAHMRLEAASTSAPVRGVVDTSRMALMGHSYGGASGLSAITSSCFPPVPLCSFQRPPELVGGAFFGTNLATPLLGVPALDTGGVPVLLVQGDRDGKALPADAQRTYEQIQKRPKAIVTLLGANHYGITDVDDPPGADPEVSMQTLDHAQGVASTARVIGLFLAAFVEGDVTARDALRRAGSIDPNVTITLAE